MKRVVSVALLYFALIVVGLYSMHVNNVEPVERSIDGVAAYLGYFDGVPIENVNEDMPGALAGKYFVDGPVYIYQFDPDSPAYEFQQTQTSDCVEGFVILYDFDVFDAKTEYMLMEQSEKLEKIKFEE